jgi:hypothetical protein
MRTGRDEFNSKGELVNGFDYEKEAWVEEGKYVRCGHPETMKCGCYGRRFEGLTARDIAVLSRSSVER